MKRIHWKVSRRKAEVLVALLLTVVAGTYWYGGGALFIVGMAIVSAQSFEWLVALCRKQALEIRGGTLILGALVGLILPPTAPWWAPAFGAIVGLGLGKMAFGGPFRNLFNPAIVGIVALVAIFPGLFLGYTLGYGGRKVDAISGATPLQRSAREAVPPPHELLIQLSTGPVGASIGESSGGALLIGGLLLIFRQTIDWLVPASIFATVILFAFLYGENPLLQVFSGGLILCAFFMATDIATAPVTRLGKFIHGLWLGVVVALIREFTEIPSEGVAYGLLAMNGLTPLINKMCRMGVTATRSLI